MAKSSNFNFGFSIAVNAHPSSKKPRLIMKEPGVFDVYVSEPAEHGRANDAIRRVLADYYKVGIGFIQLQTGEKSKRKRYTVLVDSKD